MLQTTQHGEVTQIKMSRYPDFGAGLHVSAYFVDGLLIDSGPAHTAAELTAFLRDKSLKLVVNTHHHEDHIAANAFLAQTYGVEIFAHPLAKDKINQPAALFPYQQEVWGDPVPSRVSAIGSCVETEHLRFEVIHTPGHERDHICLFEPTRGWAFTGDVFVGSRPRILRPQDHIWQIIADLNKIRAFTPRMLFTSVGRVVTEPESELVATVSYLEALGQTVAQLHRRGLSPEHIVQHIFGNESPMAEFTQHQFSSLNLVKSFLSEVA